MRRRRRRRVDFFFFPLTTCDNLKNVNGMIKSLTAPKAVSKRPPPFFCCRLFWLRRPPPRSERRRPQRDAERGRVRRRFTVVRQCFLRRRCLVIRHFFFDLQVLRAKPIHLDLLRERCFGIMYYTKILSDNGSVLYRINNKILLI